MTLTVSGLTVRRGRRAVVDGIDLAVPAGRVVALLGPNGAGKTTLLRALAGLEGRAAGTARFEGQPLAGRAPAALAACRAFMAQQFDCPFAYSVEQVVALGRSAHAGTERALGNRAAVASGLAAADLAGLSHRAVPTLSGGERQRVAFAKVWAQLHDRRSQGLPHLLLLDEPTSSLDPEHQHRLLEKARDTAACGGTVVMSLHDLGLASLYADEVVVLRAGRIVAQGPTAVTLTAARIAEVFRVAMQPVALPDGRSVLHPMPRVPAASQALAQAFSHHP